MPDRKAIVIGISGCSSSGKTTLARLLRDIFPNTFILHQDDFYKPEDELPIKDGLVDWDCAESLSLPDMEAALKHIHETGSFPVSSSLSSSPDPYSSPAIPPSSPSQSSRPSLTHRSSHGCVPPSPPPPSANPKLTSQTFIASKEDQNTVGAVPVSAATIASLKSRVATWLSPSHPGHLIFSSQQQPPAPAICLLDGFLLYTAATAAVMRELDIKLFLLVSRAAATARRSARDGYVTLEGFWTDPPGYVDRIVWPNYAAAHAWLFAGGDVEAGRLREDVLAREGIRAQTGSAAGEGRVDVDMETTLVWAVDTVMRELERVVLGREGEGEGTA